MQRLMNWLPVPSGLLPVKKFNVRKSMFETKRMFERINKERKDFIIYMMFLPLLQVMDAIDFN